MLDLDLLFVVPASAGFLGQPMNNCGRTEWYSVRLPRYGRNAIPSYDRY